MSSFLMQFARRAAGLAISFFPLSAFAQTPHHPAAPEAKPTVAGVAPRTATGLRYESVFAPYKTYRDEKTGSWLSANETVERIGGWRAYAKEAQPPDAATPAMPAMPANRSKPAAPAQSDPHAGHGGKP